MTMQQMTIQKAKMLLVDMLNRLEVHCEDTLQKAQVLQSMDGITNADVTATIQDYIDRVKALEARPRTLLRRRISRPLRRTPIRSSWTRKPT